jgi:hypothetical protein
MFFAWIPVKDSSGAWRWLQGMRVTEDCPLGLDKTRFRFVTIEVIR